MRPLSSTIRAIIINERKILFNRLVFLHKLTFILATCFFFQNSFASSKTDLSMKNIHELIQKRHLKVNKNLNIFKKTKQISFLSTVKNILYSMSVDKTADPIEKDFFVKEKVAMIAEFFNTIDIEIDEHFDSAEVPQMSVAPPPESGIPSGASVESVRDPIMREKYAQKIALNNEKTIRYNYQYKLKELDTSATEATQDFFEDEYVQNEHGHSLLLATVGHSKMSAIRKKKFLHFINTAKE